MARICEVCGKGSTTGNRITRRGKAKKVGGIGRNVTGVARKVQKPNLQKVRAIVDGSPKRVKVCTSCLKAGKIERAL